MAVKKSCLRCGNGFIGRTNAAYCSPACRLRAHRGRGGSDETASATNEAGSGETDETVSQPKRRRPRQPSVTVAAGQEHSHTPEAVALLAALNAEAAENAEARGDPPLADGQDDWSAAERVVLEMIACAVDRKVDLSARYSAADDEKLRIKLSGELRLLQGHIAQLLKQVKTDLPDPPTRVSQKASAAAQVRWRRGPR